MRYSCFCYSLLYIIFFVWILWVYPVYISPVHLFNSNTHHLAKKNFNIVFNCQIGWYVFYPDTNATCRTLKLVAEETGFKKIKNSSSEQKRNDFSGVHYKSTINPNLVSSHVKEDFGVNYQFNVSMSTCSHLIVPNSIYLRIFSVQMSSNQTFSESNCFLND